MYATLFSSNIQPKKKREMHWSFNFFFFTSIRSSFLYINKNIGRSIQVAKFNSEWCWMGRKKAVVCVLSPEFIQYYFFCLVRFCFFGGASHQFFCCCCSVSIQKKTLIQGWLLFFLTFAISIHYSLLFLLYWIWFMMVITHTHTYYWCMNGFFSLVIVQSNTVAIAHTFVNVIFCRWLMNRMFFFVCKIKIYKYYDTYSHGWLNWFDRTK